MFKKYGKRKIYIGILLVCLIFFELAMRVAVATLGNSNDIQAWKTVSDIMLTGKSVYANTMSYNYGPLWSYTLGIIGHLVRHAGVYTITPFHMSVAFFLGIIDVLISFTLWKMYGKIPGLLFLLNPISLLISGYHSQFDNFAILIGFWSWYFFIRSQSVTSNKPYFISAILLGLSFSIKHDLLFLPIWLLFLKDKQNRSPLTRLQYIAIPYIIFIFGFLIEIFRNFDEAEKTIQGIQLWVIAYKGNYGTAGIIQLVNQFFPSAYIDAYFHWVPLFKGFTFLFVLLLLLSGYIFAKKIKDIRYIFPLYLVAFFSLASSVTDQYMVIPLAAFAIFYNRWEAFVYSFVTIVYLLNGPSANIGGDKDRTMNLGIGNAILPFFPWNMKFKFNDTQVQAWALLFLFNSLFTIRIYSMQVSHSCQAYIDIIHWIWEKIKKHVVLITVILYILTSISLVCYLYLEFFNINPYTGNHFNNRITTVSATYGPNCGGRKNNELNAVKAKCNGTEMCNYTIQNVTTTDNCNNNALIEWSCQNDHFIRPVYFTYVDGESADKTIKLYCSNKL